ncbi:MAG: STAS domain-containing protein [Pirellulales bacterium]|jgi:anti-anti-sigma regulatory factor|nr:STAS domain-containing protein [Pirellulales bacterium]
MLQVAGGWSLHVERGPDWLFVRVVGRPETPEADASLAELLWSLLQQHFTWRLVLECDQLGPLSSALVGQLVLLHKRIASNSGLMRLCGLSDMDYQVLSTMRLDGRFPRFRDRVEAVLGYRPRQPR